ncbi:MAG: hypothetical protein H8E70_05380 [Candidatus Marinimicrobia bacterium]|nr:hypothetical protein [Candidatus Neomarinimicrobiota bacterium]
MQSLKMKFRWIWICIILIVIYPSFMNACPVCAGQDNTLSDILVPITLLLGTPFAVAGIFIAVVLKHNKTEKENA